MVRSAEELFAIEKMAPQGLDSKKIAETGSSSGTEMAENTSFNTSSGTPQHYPHTQTTQQTQTSPTFQKWAPWLPGSDFFYVPYIVESTVPKIDESLF